MYVCWNKSIFDDTIPKQNTIQWVKLFSVKESLTYFNHGVSIYCVLNRIICDISTESVFKGAYLQYKWKVTGIMCEGEQMIMWVGFNLWHSEQTVATEHTCFILLSQKNSVIY